MNPKVTMIFANLTEQLGNMRLALQLASLSESEIESIAIDTAGIQGSGWICLTCRNSCNVFLIRDALVASDFQCTASLTKRTIIVTNLF